MPRRKGAGTSSPATQSRLGEPLPTPPAAPESRARDLSLEGEGRHRERPVAEAAVKPPAARSRPARAEGDEEGQEMLLARMYARRRGGLQPIVDEAFLVAGCGRLGQPGIEGGDMGKRRRIGRARAKLGEIVR